MRRLALILAALAIAACGDELDELDPPAPASEEGGAHNFDVVRVATGLNRPVWVGAAPGDPGALWVLEQPGRVVRLADGRRTRLLDMSDQVLTGAEQGLLGIAFHPDFATTGRLFLHWSDRRGDTRVAEFRARPDHTLEPRPIRQLLMVDQPEENHNGGQLAFGPDDRLYLGLGDGGGAFDPRVTAQDPQNLLGKLIAADVDAPMPRWKVVLTGLRNPWRFWFDPALGEIWIGDVGQDEVEEIDRVPLELDEPPKNLGWSAFEGTRRIGGHELDRGGELVWPVAVYGHGEGGGCSVTGGLVYGGGRLPGMVRRYVYGDYCAGTLWSLRGAPQGRVEDLRRERANVPLLAHIGTDSDGELVFASGAGDVYLAVPPAGS
ncbi:MAG TPA: PQQ-dependent sugar dehydrogenase [Solirubrobacteraceae bacterium]|nr:PQQ-dependent sugar dehydrogenase [Solirubrobacteraceae bacterium]